MGSYFDTVPYCRLSVLIHLPIHPNPVAMKKIYAILSLILVTTTLSALPAPDFTVTTSDGVVRYLYQDYVNQGKVLVIEAFFTSCPPCTAHAPYWQALYQAMQAAHPGQVEFMLLSTLNSDTNVKVAQYLANKGLTMPGAGANGSSITALQPYMSGQFGDFQGTPTFIVIAPGSGAVHFDIQGNSIQQTMSLLEQKISEVLPQECFLKSNFDNPLDSVLIHVDAPAFDTTFLASAYYTLSGIPQLENTPYTVSATKTGIALDGVTTLDLVKISKHILDIELFTQAWQFQAADVNCSGTVTTTDIVQARKVILGITDTLPCGTWRLLPDPVETTENGACLNFRGTKLGDLNGPNLMGDVDDRSVFALTANNMVLTAGQDFTLQLMTRENSALEGLQLDLGFDAAAIHIHELNSICLPDINKEAYHIQHQSVKFSWIGSPAADIPAGIPLLQITGTALRSGRLADALYLQTSSLHPEAYLAQVLAQKIELVWQDAGPISPAVAIVPNPAGACFQVVFEGAQSEERLLQLIDHHGKIAFSSTIQVSTGRNAPTIRTGQLPGGMYYLKMDGKPAGTVFLSGR